MKWGWPGWIQDDTSEGGIGLVWFGFNCVGTVLMIELGGR